MFSPRAIILLGRSGSGKGTQAELLQVKLQPCLHVITGDLFRELAARESLAGRKIKAVLEKGGLPEEWLAEFLWQRELLEKLTGSENIIFDGSPRRLGEAEELDSVLAWLGYGNVRVVLIDISEEEALARLLKRGRADDSESVIKARLEWFNENVLPALDYYDKSRRLVRVDGVGAVEDIHQRIKQVLNIS